LYRSLAGIHQLWRKIAFRLVSDRRIAQTLYGGGQEPEAYAKFLRETVKSIKTEATKKEPSSHRKVLERFLRHGTWPNSDLFPMVTLHSALRTSCSLMSAFT